MRISIFLIMIILFILSACGKGPAPSTASNPNQAYTQIWQTVAAGQTQTAGAATAIPQASSTPEVTDTPNPTITPLVSSTPSTQATLAATKTKAPPPAETSCDNFQFIADVSYPDGTQVPAGTTILKTWRIKNTGPCDWSGDYTLTFGWGGAGTDWNASSPVGFGNPIKVGQTLDISIELHIPQIPGEYFAVFRTRNADEFYFGPSLTIKIVVK